MIVVLTLRGEEEHAAGQETLDSALEELLLVEERGVEPGVVELRVLARVLRAHVLVEDAQRQHRLGRVEHVVHGNEKRLKERLRGGGRKERKK